jgi:hypothetical protein
MQQDMDAAGAVAWRKAVREAYETQLENGYQNKTRRLSASMKWKTWEPSKFGYRGEIKTSAPYAVYVDLGTRPHDIPKAGSGKTSVFFWPKIGRWVRFTSDNPAKHPGFKGAGFTAEAIQRFGQGVSIEVEKAFAKAAK